MSESTRCWWCTHKLVGPGGIVGRLPLYYREVETGSGKVRVHAKCEGDALKSLLKVTAQPREAP